jgi:hypothetical protein
MDQQVPGLVLDKQAGSVVHHEPTKVFEILEIDWLIDGKSEVPTTFGSAIIAERFVFL